MIVLISHKYRVQEGTRENYREARVIHVSDTMKLHFQNTSSKEISNY